MSFVGAITPASLPPYLLWRARGRNTDTTLRLREGPRLRFRPVTPTANDYGLAYEVFVHRWYDCPRPIDRGAVRLIVDLGANVGFTPLYWTATYPQAEVIAYEPHPAHVAQCRANLAFNRGGARVRLRAAAAGRHRGFLRLSDAGTSSAEVAPAADGIDVPVEDCLADLAGCPIDILKIDIEGGEYAIMDDARFGRLEPRRIVMEWHDRGDGHDGRWCTRRLRAIGYDIQPIFDEGTHGMLWAFRT